ncbi:Nre family DNA repair protein, partial [Candidatus Micrarchaeota archaeon]|nr:Nre family DNA repair protein [Candidatus Micrarchaeota archaeon]
VGKDLEGSTPPSVFIGSWNYPKVFAGPMIAPQHGDTEIMDAPESWIPEHKSQEDIVGFRLNLVRGKYEVRINDLDNKFVEKLRDISLSKSSIESEAEFKSIPRGFSFSEDHSPFGPSAPVEKFEVGNCSWQHNLEKVFYDTDLRAAEAVVGLHNRGLSFSQIQKAFSVGTMGTKRRRKLVPTRWSITACDTILADNLLDEVRHFEILDRYQIYEFSSLNNHYAVLLTPTAWQYEWTEAFLKVMGSEEMVFSDYETNRGKKEYSSVGGCYYSCKFGVLEALKRMKKQAGALVLREAYSGYVPLGVFNVRENVRHALLQKPKEFFTLRSSLAYLSLKLKLPLSRFVQEGALLRDLLEGRQSSLISFF